MSSSKTESERIKIDTLTCKDYNKVFCFLKENGIDILNSNKCGMVLIVDMPWSSVERMKEELHTSEDLIVQSA